MSCFTRRDLIYGSLCSAFLTYVPAVSAKTPQIIDVRTWPADEYTRVTIESDAPLKLNYFMLRVADPIRLVVDMDGLRLTDKLKNIIQKVKPNDPYIQRIRCGQYKPTVVRITIDFKQDVSPQIFSLKPAGTYKYRTVFDVYPVQEKDPILAILKKEEEEPDAVQKLVAQVAEGQKRMEENREEADADQLEQILAGIESGTLVPVKPEVQPSAGKTPKPSSQSIMSRNRTFLELLTELFF